LGFHLDVDACGHVRSVKQRIPKDAHTGIMAKSPPDIAIVDSTKSVLFSAETGDAWMLDPSDQIAAPFARDGDPEPIDIQETETNSPSAGKVTTALRAAHSYTPIESPAASLPSLATPPPRLLDGARSKISNIFG
jgi:hypothetical protein